MQMVIDIDEYFAKLINENEFGLYDGRVYNAIRKGTPLPKGHGRLIDADEIIRLTNEIGAEDREEELYHLFLKTVLTDAPTLIEADKAESEK